MLKALELVGFKSFADKTRFEFSRGITAVVGPNGSGKSNVVDAIKWVLGEQSVKSLRGKEMADVIFNGSSNRPPLNAAETTLSFDNSRRLLAIDAPEVHITRRVYRSGEGEYLINRQPCRLRDIRELFAGTGVGGEAYGVIEQGKVDMMLQSSPKERRLIFEEAAGISRFKAKKVESLRRLERVEQNLVRLSDIVAEVESRLRSVRSQASKARRYQEHADRLQQLRTHTARADWQTLAAKLAATETELAAEIEKLEQARRALDAAEADRARTDAKMATLEDTIRASEARAGDCRRRIIADEAAIEHQTGRSRDLEEEAARLRAKLAALDLHLGDSRQQLQQAIQQAADAESVHGELLERVRTDQQQLEAQQAKLLAARGRLEQQRAAQLDQIRSIAATTGEVSTLDAQIAGALAEQERSVARLAEVAQAHEQLAVRLAELQREHIRLEEEAESCQAAVDTAQHRLADYRRHHAARSAELNQLRQRHSGASERAAVLSELENRFEGLGAAVKDVLLTARRRPSGPYRAVRGLLADLFRVNMEMAPLVDLALGERSQFIVVDDDSQFLDFWQSEAANLKGRVGIVRLSAAAGPEPAAELDGVEGVIGRADRFIETSSELLCVARHLLGRTWIVADLPRALQLASAAPGLDFVTMAGEVVASDGTISVGPRQSGANLISRRSELRLLHGLVSELEATIGQMMLSLSRLEQQMAADEESLAVLVAEQKAGLEKLAEQRIGRDNLDHRLADQRRQQAVLEQELAAAELQLARSQQSRAEAEARRVVAEQSLTAHEQQLATIEQDCDSLAAARETIDRQVTQRKIEAAKSEERLEALRARRDQFHRDQQERDRAIDEARAQLGQCLDRSQASTREILRVESELAGLYLEKESFERLLRQQHAERVEVRDQRAVLAAAAQTAAAQMRTIDERKHALELSAHAVRHERQALAERMQEDYGIDLENAAELVSDEPAAERTSVDEEIAELRRKINQLGNVNLDALPELDELESRYGHLAAQHADMVKAKDQIAQIVHRINADSRRLFSETLDAVKQNFATLFRQLFGGGQADIVLEPGVDILESGIEIIARPPGKEPRNISLLSGGEKTLTCVALLLAIFQYRPSPFCVLDEVDAALDEANIERFVGVLHDFLAWTQFVIVTHSKKTMTCASTLYGVTMEESGVSKRVAVRFEDVSETGEISISDAGGENDDTQAA